MLRGRPALVIVFLCFVCLLPPLNSRSPCSQDIIPKLQKLIHQAAAWKWLDCRFYTPNTTDFKICPSSTLQCFAHEINVLNSEWEISRNIRRMWFTKLGKLSAMFNQTESGCRQCELLEEQNAEDFLKSLLKTIQFMNTLYCLEPNNEQRGKRPLKETSFDFTFSSS